MVLRREEILLPVQCIRTRLDPHINLPLHRGMHEQGRIMGKGAKVDGTLEAPKLLLDSHGKRTERIHTGSKRRRYHNTTPTDTQQQKESPQAGIQRIGQDRMGQLNKRTNEKTVDRIRKKTHT
jgi:hypothetical protein